MFAIYYHKQTGAIRIWGDESATAESMLGPDYAVSRFAEPQTVDPLLDMIDVETGDIISRTRAERAEVMRPVVTNAIADELEATDKYMTVPPDRPASVATNSDAWREYRQALRDLRGPVEEILEAWPHRPDGIDAVQHLRDRLRD